MDEFQEGSRELEAELEAQLEQAESRQKELLSIKTRLETDNENLKVFGIVCSGIPCHMLMYLQVYVNNLKVFLTCNIMFWC